MLDLTPKLLDMLLAFLHLNYLTPLNTPGKYQYFSICKTDSKMFLNLLAKKNTTKYLQIYSHLIVLNLQYLILGQKTKTTIP